MGATVVDLRSDTVTRPTPGMRRAIADAEVGDYLMGDDPTARRLEERVAELLGKERALFFPSGIMANQTALAVLGRWATEVIVEAGAHIYNYEDAAPAAWTGLQLRPVPTGDGRLTAEHVRQALRRRGSVYQPVTSVVAMENTHVDSGGTVMSLETTGAIAEVARERGLRVHLDGARLWNASVASGHEPAAFAAHADTVMVSLSKGLGAPVGSLLAGDRATMESASRVRRRMGGGMRQVGILAAAGLYALDHHVERLAEDHANARRLAARVNGVPGLGVTDPESNIVMIHLEAPELEEAKVLGFLEKHGILMRAYGPRRLRAVTHLDVNSEGIERAAAALAEAAERLEERRS
ncbi:MAG: aminotransferase class I/II-fold pyridoxal phosphate-dependent enzyme [Gemmatimonadetes bacterium]|nr:aminotransferase class I/II-fold pyridoxal phosphate-dependent enzyme [Gemmatimonadota bacterium]